jgi:hypothetical protein
VPEINEVQEAMSTMKGQQLKTLISKDTTLNFPVWNNCTKEAMLMHLIATWTPLRRVVTLRPPKKPRLSTWKRKMQ